MLGPTEVLSLPFLMEEEEEEEKEKEEEEEDCLHLPHLMTGRALSRSVLR